MRERSRPWWHAELPEFSTTDLYRSTLGKRPGWGENPIEFRVRFYAEQDAAGRWVTRVERWCDA